MHTLCSRHHQRYCTAVGICCCCCLFVTRTGQKITLKVINFKKENQAMSLSWCHILPHPTHPCSAFGLSFPLQYGCHPVCQKSFLSYPSWSCVADIFTQISDSSGLLLREKFEHYLQSVLALPTAVFEGPSFGYNETAVRACFDLVGVGGRFCPGIRSSNSMTNRCCIYNQYTLSKSLADRDKIACCNILQRIDRAIPITFLWAPASASLLTTCF